eukprot:COSAG03_NODE_2070_length_3156_cov_7.928361_4_plen_35_part_00
MGERTVSHALLKLASVVVNRAVVVLAERLLFAER